MQEYFTKVRCDFSFDFLQISSQLEKKLQAHLEEVDDEDLYVRKILICVNMA